jgi:hypothetical protein
MALLVDLSTSGNGDALTVLLIPDFRGKLILIYICARGLSFAKDFSLAL